MTWLPDPQGITIGADELYLSPLDMAKIAYLYLHNGQWAGKQIVSASWVQAATSTIVTNARPSLALFDGYGYGWNVSGSGQEHYFAQFAVAGEQFGVFPELDLIYMVTGDVYFSLTSLTDTGRPAAALFHDLLPAISTSAKLPENADGLATLNTKIQALANPTPRDAAALPAAFRAVSGKTYTLETNDAGWQTLSLDFGAPGSQEATLTLGINGSPVKLTAGLDFVSRITPVGLPAQPVSGAYRLLGDLPWSARVSWIGKLLTVWTGDLMGRENWQVTLQFPSENRVIVHAALGGLTWPPPTWAFGGTAG